MDIHQQLEQQQQKSDITVIVENAHFQLHKFPLSLRSDYFRNNLNKSTTQITLPNFPGGASIFTLIADYCYNNNTIQETRIDESNVIETICACEYLKMTNARLLSNATSTLFDLTYSSRTPPPPRSLLKRDYKLTLHLVSKAGKYSELFEACGGVYKKLIDALAESLVGHVKDTGVYESISIYSKVKVAEDRNRSRRHELVVGEEDLKVVCGLPVRWAVDLVRAGLRLGLDKGLVGYLVQRYVDWNAGMAGDKQKWVIFLFYKDRISIRTFLEISKTKML